MCLEKFFSSILPIRLGVKSPTYFFVMVDDFILFWPDSSLDPCAELKKLL
jgi:hypothetical protein